MKDDTGPLLNAADCARQVGVTVRALRLYEQHGLIRPVRSAKGWRLYGGAEISRLAAIVTLKSFGLGLKDIAAVLRREPNLEAILRLRAEAWRTAIGEAQQGLLLTEAALRLLAHGQSLSVTKLCELTRSMQMQTMPKAFMDAANTLYTQEEQADILARKMALKDDPTEGAAAWAVLIDDVRALIAANADPASTPARAAARRWSDLVRAFSGGDAAIEGKSAQLWKTALADDPEGRTLPFGMAEWEFVRAAMDAERAAGAGS